MGDKTEEMDVQIESETAPNCGTTADREVVPPGDSAKEVLEQVNELRKVNGAYSDLVIKVGGKLFPAHKIIMAAFSPYFKMRMTTESGGENTLELTGMKAEIFDIILEYAYTGSIVITEANAEDLLRSSCRLEASRLKNICEQFLGRKTSLENFWKFYGIASDCSCSVLAGYVNEFIVENFADVCQTDRFLEMKPEMLIDAIKCDDVNVFSEEDVLDAVLKWTNHDKDREPFLIKLLGYVRLACVDPGYLWKCINEESATRTSPDCAVLLSKALMYKFRPDCMDEEPSASLITPRDVRLLTPDEVVVLSGRQGPSSDGVPASDWFYSLNLRTREFKPLKPLPDKYVRTAVSLNADTMYALCETSSEKFDRVCMKYKFQSDTWEIMSQDIGSRPVEGLIELNGFVYAKFRGNNNFYSRTPSTTPSHWNSTPPMPGTSSVSVCFRVDDMIYAIGHSVNASTVEPSFARYDPTTMQWTKLASLLQSEEEYLYCPFGGRIYVFCGAKNKDASVMRPQVYDIAADKWEWGPPLSNAYKHPAALLVVDNRLTFIDMDRFPCLHIERLSPLDNTWKRCEVRLNCNLRKDDLRFCAGALKIKQS